MHSSECCHYFVKFAKVNIYVYLLGANDKGIDLLPSPTLTTTWTRSLPTDDGKESDQVFYFDGESNAVEVPRDQFDHTLHQHFTIMTWMKHDFAESTAADKKGPKETILCMSDGDGRFQFKVL